MDFYRESDFENALTKLLFTKGWESQVLKYKTEKELINNWANILFENNRDVDRLNDFPLTEGEMSQILEQITLLRTPLKLNGFINGKTVAIVRDNPDDTLHFGKEVSLKIYDRQEIAAGQSRYQIAVQPKFPTRGILNDRRGDMILLINGMPVIHIELKKSGVSVSQACNQIEKYSHEGIFSGLFSLVQIFVAMTPTETIYFANPGPDGKFNKDYYFHWADFNNEPINDWEGIASDLLSIPMAHQLIGFYTVPDDTDGILKVMRSYQYYAASKISDRVAKIRWGEKNIYGGHIWHTTGSGKTMTSFKSAQLISSSKDADKVIFLMDRIELGLQSLREYRGFADDSETVQSTEDSGVLLTKLKSDDPANTLIVTSIQKMSRIKEEGAFNDADIRKINKKRIVFIVDEAHRSTFGDMMIVIKKTFPNAIFFGFTGTPILDENQKKLHTTATVFGSLLHRYSIADGIRDKNVLGFDPYMICTYQDRELKKAVALEKAKAKTEEEAFVNEKKKAVYLEFMRKPMAGYYDDNNKYVKGIEDYIPDSQYEKEENKELIVKDILQNWVTLSCNGKFHALFATSSINEAIDYYRIFKKLNNNLKVTALFDPNIDNNGNGPFKEDGLKEIIEDYNRRYGQNYAMATANKLKKDIALRLAHKSPYLSIGNDPDKQINLLIVVDQMLTGFDSKWINTLYLDKLLKQEYVVQAFSRTNRLFGKDKPFGTIRYYRRPHTMKRNIDEAFALYSGDKKFALFADRLGSNLNSMNHYFQQIKQVFHSEGILNFERLPQDITAKGRFASLFRSFNLYLEAAKIQGFVWSKLNYEFVQEDKTKTVVTLSLDENIYMALVLRYKELFNSGGGGGDEDDPPYEIESSITEINTDAIDADYMNSRFVKYLKSLNNEESDEAVKKALDDLHCTFATLTQEEQKYANIFLHDVQSGSVIVEEGKTLKDYIIEYMTIAKNDQIHKFATVIGIDENKLREFMKLDVTDRNINEYGRFDKLKNSVDKNLAKSYFEKKAGKTMPMFRVTMMLDEILRKFVLTDGYDLE